MGGARRPGGLRSFGALAFTVLTACPLALAAPAGFDAQLQHADAIKSADNPAFVATVDGLAAQRARLSEPQRELLTYLQGWQAAYRGDFQTAIPRLTALADGARDADVRFRANVTLVNMLEISHRYELAYERMQRVIEALPRAAPAGRQQALGVASALYVAAGQADLALDFANRLLAEASDGHIVCKGMQHRQEAYFAATRDREFLDGLAAALDACDQAHEPIYANMIRVLAAQTYLRAGRSREAADLLAHHRDEAQATHYDELTSKYDAILARALFEHGDAAQAQQMALASVAEGIKGQVTTGQSDAFLVLYRLAKARGDSAQALSYHEQMAAADKGYLNDISARALAWQMVRQQVMAKKAQVAALSQQNQVLLLRQAIDRKNLLTIQLGVALLLLVLGSIALYAVRAKRVQIRFRNLAQHDGLTGISNHQHFVAQAGQALRKFRPGTPGASLIAIDLDHFKQINDQHGHAAGDLALKAAVATCNARLGPADIFGRTGGEEFCVLLPDCAPERALRVAESMREGIAALGGPEPGIGFQVTASFGVANTRHGDIDLRSLMAQADLALYQAKRSGRNQVCLHDAAPSPGSGPPSGVAERRQA